MEGESLKSSTILILVGWILVIISLIIVYINWMGLPAANTNVTIGGYGFWMTTSFDWVPFLIIGLGPLSSASTMILISVIILVVALIMQLVGVIWARREGTGTSVALVLVGWFVVLLSFILLLIGWIELFMAVNNLNQFFVYNTTGWILAVLGNLSGLGLVFTALMDFFAGIGAISTVSTMIMISTIILVVAAVIELACVILALRK